MSEMSRRLFLQGTMTAAAGMAVGNLAAEQVAKAPASERIRIGVMGAGGRAARLIHSFCKNPQAEVVAIADIDPRRFPWAVKEVQTRQGKEPRITQDFRELIDTKDIDALVIGTPDHWHAIPTIWACQAGKDVYVEKPDGHNIVEGQTMCAVATTHHRVVQMGTQARSTSRMHSAIEFIRSGRLGRCLVAKAWESSKQGAIGYSKEGNPPEGVDYDMWLGPAPQRPFTPNRFHGRWRWFYDYGTGDLGNDGVHRMDVAYWALKTACETEKAPELGLPTRVSALGGKWYFDDEQEWPDTLQVTYEFESKPSRLLTYEMRVWSPYPMFGESEGAALYGDQGVLVLGNERWKAYAPDGSVMAEGAGGNDEAEHVENFLNCLKSRETPNADLVTVGHPSSLLCHMGNVATRVKRTLQFDAKTESFLHDEEANALRTRPEYRKPWTLERI